MSTVQPSDRRRRGSDQWPVASSSSSSSLSRRHVIDNSHVTGVFPNWLVQLPTPTDRLVDHSLQIYMCMCVAAARRHVHNTTAPCSSFVVSRMEFEFHSTGVRPMLETNRFQLFMRFQSWIDNNARMQLSRVFATDYRYTGWPKMNGTIFVRLNFIKY